MTISEPSTADAPTVGIEGGLASGVPERTVDVAGAPRNVQTPPQFGADALATRDLSAAAMIIRTGSARLEVDSLELGIARVRQLARRLGGYVANTSIRAGEQQSREAMLELKLPAARFDEAVSGLTPLGEVESVEVRAEDVGEEFVDISARLENARRLEERYLRLLESRTAELQQVLAVERELARVREEIERFEGRLRYLRTRAAVSTLSVLLHEPLPIVGKYPGTSPIRDAVRQAWENFVGFTAGLIALLGILVPLAVLVGVAWWVWRQFRGPESRPRRTATPPAASEPPQTVPRA